jgi:hypothetical protein
MAEISGQRYAQHNFVSIASVPYSGSSNSRECTIKRMSFNIQLPTTYQEKSKV